MITSAYSKSSNFSGFNTILQKFCMMICEIKLSTKRCTEFSWCLVDRVLVIILLWRAIFQNLYNYRNLNISRPVYLEKNSAHRFEDHICTKKLEEGLQGLGAFFTTAEPLIWTSFFSANNFTLFFKCGYLILMQY